MLKRPSGKGFTLIEMLIAISLLGIMVVLLFASLRIAAESWNSGEAKISQVNKKAVVYQFFKRHLANAKPLPAHSNGQQQDSPELGAEEQPKLAFQGSPETIVFVSALPAASARKGLQVFHVGLDPKQPSVLKVTLTPYQQIESTTSDAEPVVLLDHLQRFRISYFNSAGNEGEGDSGWQDTWQDAGQLPKLVKIGITLEDGSFWPDMIFPLKITSPLNSGEVISERYAPGAEKQ